ncbi:MAG TPA: hypothetical protein VE570_13205 [Thermoleophilaceae bacterium]|jgi:hypothetical protein|nr:hypothetical protein [Thermoleophilaceae bacterium]
MRRTLAVASVAVLIAGCGSERDQSLPAACTNGPGAVVKALAKAPARVTIGGTRISDCFVRGANGDALQILGTTLLAAAQQLGDRARSGDEQAAMRLGYLIGAAHRGAAHNGLAAEMIRRLDSETRTLGRMRPAFQRGLRAGSHQG